MISYNDHSHWSQHQSAELERSAYAHLDIASQDDSRDIHDARITDAPEICCSVQADACRLAASGWTVVSPSASTRPLLSASRANDSLWILLRAELLRPSECGACLTTLSESCSARGHPCLLKSSPLITPCPRVPPVRPPLIPLLRYPPDCRRSRDVISGGHSSVEGFWPSWFHRRPLSRCTVGGADRGAGRCELIKVAVATFLAALVSRLSGMLFSDAAIPSESWTGWGGLPSGLKAG